MCTGARASNSGPTLSLRKCRRRRCECDARHIRSVTGSAPLSYQFICPCAGAERPCGPQLSQSDRFSVGPFSVDARDCNARPTISASVADVLMRAASADPAPVAACASLPCEETPEDRASTVTRSRSALDPSGISSAIRRISARSFGIGGRPARDFHRRKLQSRPLRKFSS
jgi:hypothetical protein